MGLIRKIKNSAHLIQSVLAQVYFGFPARRLKLIGVTGTDGKTTTVHLIYHLLKSARKKVSMVSTVYAKIGEEEFDTGLHTTTPDCFKLQRFLKQAVDNRDEFFVLEVTSHGLDQNRVFGLRFFIGVLTNITHEHLDYHRTYQNYLLTKAKLLLNSETAVINADDSSFKSLSQILENKKISMVTYGLGKGDDFSFDLGKDLTLFNKYNYLAAYTVGRLVGLSEKEIKRAIKTFKLPPGRLELVYNKGFKVIIDFAHTPYAIKEVLKAIKEKYLNKGRLIHVFGSAGLRDSSKRPLMGEASGQYSDLVILTEEDYRTEDPVVIAEQIAEGLKKQGFNKDSFQQPVKRNHLYTIIVNRKEAIRKAVSIAKKGDVIVFTGKAHEKSLCRGKVEFGWDEKAAVMEAIKKTGLLN